jgi:hypothetical protein
MTKPGGGTVFASSWSIVIRHLHAGARFVLVWFRPGGVVCVDHDGQLWIAREQILHVVLKYLPPCEAERLMSLHEGEAVHQANGEGTLVDAYYIRCTPSTN